MSLAREYVALVEILVIGAIGLAMLGCAGVAVGYYWWQKGEDVDS